MLGHDSSAFKQLSAQAGILDLYALPPLSFRRLPPTVIPGLNPKNTHITAQAPFLGCGTLSRLPGLNATAAEALDLF